MINPSHYLFDNPKHTTHFQIAQTEFHNNTIGPWLPHHAGTEGSKVFYYASMLMLLKPWRNLQHLKGEMDDWKFAFDMFIETANQQDRDVIAGSQYYHESKCGCQQKQ